MNIHVSNLSIHIIADDLRLLFAAFGKVNDVVIIRNELTGQSKGSAVIYMEQDSQAKQAIQCLDRTVIDGKAISVTEIRHDISNYKN